MVALFRLMKSDVKAMIYDRGCGRLHFILSALAKILLFPRIQAVLLYRLSHWLYSLHLLPLAYLLQAVALLISGAEIHPAARIGRSFCLMHSNGVVIGDRVVIGDFFFCLQGVTVGDSGTTDGQPIVGDSVKISAGAKVLGPITLGNYAVVGANAVVLICVPAHGVAVGVPARVVKIKSGAGETLEEVPV